MNEYRSSAQFQDTAKALNPLAQMADLFGLMNNLLARPYFNLYPHMLKAYDSDQVLLKLQTKLLQTKIIDHIVNRRLAI